MKHSVSKKVIGLMCIICFGLPLLFWVLPKEDPLISLKDVSKVQVQVAGSVIDAWYLDTKPLLAKGLSGLSVLPLNSGMFFAFEEEDFHGIWMKDMLFPIDIIWIGEDFKVVHIEKNVSPNTYPSIFFSKKMSRFVLEVNAGFVDTSSLKIGMPIKVIK